MRNCSATTTITVFGTFAAIAIGGIVGCGGPSAGHPAGTGLSGGAGGGGGHHSGGGGSQRGTGGGMGGGPGGPPTFHISGTVLRTPAALLGDADLLFAGPSAATNVTHVMAVNPSSQDPRRMVAPVSVDGSFVLDLEPGRAWVLVFIDSSRSGSDMISGIFRASELDTVAPALAGSADLGPVMIAGGTATAGIAYSDLLAALNLSPAGADFLGAADDVCLRYVNPDIDGDGVIDLNQQGHDFQLDFHVQFAMRLAAAPNGSNGGATIGATITDLADGFLPESTALLYGGVGIYATYPADFDSGDPAMTWASFQSPVHYAPGGGGPGGPRVASAGAHIPGSDLMMMRGTNISEGVLAVAGFDLPQGQYQFGTGVRTLTFTNIRTHSDLQLAGAADFIMPFVRIAKADGCSGDCPISALEFKWMKRTMAGWIPATLEELALVVNPQGGYISIVKAFDNGDQHIGLNIPSTAQAGSLPWAGANIQGLTAAELASTLVSEVCHFGLSYDDKLGMRIFSGVGNAPGTCPLR